MDAEALSGKVLGTCTLHKMIGRGSMGAVFLARQSRPRRQVAVKVLLPMTALQSYQQTAFLERFRRETDAVASLEHPNIVPVHEYGEQDGIAYLVMPYVSGGTLRDELEREGKLPLTQAVSYLEQMADALDFAHSRGVIHRDIKPANILLTPAKRLLLTDFGLVKIIANENREQTQVSGLGLPTGSPDYTSPEQAIGGEIDARADIYSLGVILYQMVTGVVPFEGEMSMQVVMHHLHTPPPSPRALRPDLPLSAEDVILQTLAKKPEDRYSHAHELASAFREALEAAGVVLPDVTGNTPSVRTVKNDRNMRKRPRSLFDPLWRGHQPHQAHDQLQSSKQETVARETGPQEVPLAEYTKPAVGMASGLASSNQVASSSKATQSTLTMSFTHTPSPDVNMMENQPTNAPARNSLLSRHRLRPENKTRLLGEEPGNSVNYPNNQGATQQPGLTGQAGTRPDPYNGMSQGQGSQGPLPNTYGPGVPQPASKTGLLRSYGTNYAQDGSAQGPNPTMVPSGVPNISNSTRQLDPPTPPNGTGNWPGYTVPTGPGGTSEMLNPPQQDPYQPEATGTFPNSNTQAGATGSFNLYNPPPGSTGVLRTQTGALIPVNPPGATGALMIPSDNENTGQTGMLKLTQSVKVVKVPLAGQPGQYVTGLLPVIPQQENGWSEQQVDTSLRGRTQKNMKALMLIAVVVVLLFGSVIFLVTRPAGTTVKPGTGQANNAAALAAQATATAQANVIVSDPLTSNIHNWPSGHDDKTGGDYNFTDGAYHVKSGSDKNDAVALLGSPKVADKFVYTISLNEVNGVDDGKDASKVNAFGVVFRLSNDDNNHVSYYTFQIKLNNSQHSYEFQKYDTAQGNDPRTSLWSGDIGGEYHSGHGVNNTLKISADGAHFTFNVNGKDVASKDDSALGSGQIGMIVNLKDTEIAYSNLLLTYR